MKNVKILVVVFIALSFQVLTAQEDTTLLTESDTAKMEFLMVEDTEIPRIIDSAISDLYGSIFLKQHFLDTNLGSNVDSFPTVSEEQKKKDIELLNKETPIELTYNRYVNAFINLYVVKKREVTQRIMGIAPYYYPMFEQELAKNNVPLEFKYLPVIESALNPKAKSRAGAMGLWQFMYRTGRMYGLKVTSYYDERMDPYKSTVAASAYLKKLYDLYGNWGLVIAAYNCGPGNVNKAIRRSGGKRTYWEIRKWLPRETRGYVPAFIAVNYVMNHPEDYNLQPVKPEATLTYTDTIHVKKQISFESLSQILKISYKELDYFNPMYKKGVIPEASRPMPLYLPSDKMGLFIVNEDSVYAYHEKIEQEKPTESRVSKAPSEEHLITHKVRSGEVLGVIAERYHCRVSQIKDWNNLWSSRIYPGQSLKIYSNKKITKPAPVEKKVTVQKASPREQRGKFTYHTIQPGDTLWDIAKKYKEITVNDLKRLNKNLNFKKLKPGDKIKVSKIG